MDAVDKAITGINAICEMLGVMFAGLQANGFTREEALYLTQAYLTAISKPGKATDGVT